MGRDVPFRGGAPLGDLEIGQTPPNMSSRGIGKVCASGSHLVEGSQTNVVTLGLVAVSLLWVAVTHDRAVWGQPPLHLGLFGAETGAALTKVC